jgi:hypothetical protein
MMMKSNDFSFTLLCMIYRNLIRTHLASIMMTALVICSLFSTPLVAQPLKNKSKPLADTPLNTPNNKHIHIPKPPSQITQNADEKRPPIERIDDQRVKVGGILVDRLHKRVEIPSRVNLTKGILEYYMVASRGKLHESVLEMLAEPSHLHLALILAGFEPTRLGKKDPKTNRKEVLFAGSMLRVYLRWYAPELQREQWLPASAWLFDRSQDAPPSTVTYVFKGSQFFKGKYIADLDRSVIGLIDDGSTVLHPTVDIGNPYQGDSLGYEVYTNAIPIKGTTVTVVIQAANQKEITEVKRYKENLAKIQKIRQARAVAEAKNKPLPAPPHFEVQYVPSPFSNLEYQSR